MGGLENWNNRVGNVTDFSYMFANNPNITNLEGLNGWQLNAGVMSFGGCSRTACASPPWTSPTGRCPRPPTVPTCCTASTASPRWCWATVPASTAAGLGLSDNTSLPRGDTFGTWQADKAR